MVMLLFLALMISVFGVVMAWGSREAKLAITVLNVAFLVTYFTYSEAVGGWLNPNWAIIVTDSAVMLVLLFIALRSKRYWPMPVTAFQIIPLMTHLTPLLGRNLESYGIGIAQGIWAYLQLAILAYAAISERKRKLNSASALSTAS